MDKRFPIVTLSDTCEMMMSKDYKDRFIAEYVQIKIRHSKLKKMLVKYELTKLLKTDYLGFIPLCSIELLSKQLEIMERYMATLEERAIIEEIELPLVAC